MLNFIYAKYPSKNKLDWPKASFVNLKTFNFFALFNSHNEFLMILTNLLFQLYYVLIIYIIVTRNFKPCC